MSYFNGLAHRILELAWRSAFARLWDIFLEIELSKDEQAIEANYTTTYFGCPPLELEIKEQLS